MHATSQEPNRPHLGRPHLVAALVLLWLFPTVGLFVSSFRTADQIANRAGGPRCSPRSRMVLPAIRMRGRVEEQTQQDGELRHHRGNLFEDRRRSGPVISRWGTARDRRLRTGDQADLGDGERITVAPNGDYPPLNDEEFSVSPRPARLRHRHHAARIHARITTACCSPASTDSMAKAFFNTLTVTIPATVIPIVDRRLRRLCAGLDGFPGRALLIAAVVGLLVVPLQLALIPLLKLHWGSASARAIWASGWRIPASACRWRSICCATTWSACRATSSRTPGRRRDRFPDLHQDHPAAVVSGAGQFAIFQFLWTWNDLLVAKVFLIDATGETTVMTNQIVELLGTRGGNWEILATSAFVSIAVPLVVFFAMQKYLVRGLLAGSVK
jgi:alpha-glucoside transport system permease protein